MLNKSLTFARFSIIHKMINLIVEHDIQNIQEKQRARGEKKRALELEIMPL